MSNVPLNIDFHQILLHLLNVAILFVILYLLVYKPVKKFMDKRKQEYREMDEQALGTVKQADELKAEYEDKLKNADEEIKAMKACAEKDINDMMSEAKEEAKLEAEEILSKAKEQAENEKEKILDSANQKITEIAREAASKAVFENSSEAFDVFLDTVGVKKV